MAASAPQDNPTPATQEDFEAIFRYPTLDKMLALHWNNFERFIAHVFECAGYRVEDVARDFFPEGPRVDLNQCAGPNASKPTARVEINGGGSRLVWNMCDSSDVDGSAFGAQAWQLTFNHATTPTDSAAPHLTYRVS